MNVEQLTEALHQLPTIRNRNLRIVGIGGTTKTDSSSEKALRVALELAGDLGASTTLIAGADLLTLPPYEPQISMRNSNQCRFVEAVRCADGLILATPAYHAGVSGLIKNALDLLEDLRQDTRPYLDGRPVGCIVTGYGSQGIGATLTSLRAIVHALRGWPTPMGVAVNSAERIFDDGGALLDQKLRSQMQIMVTQVLAFAQRFAS